jgi:hypothetical protein
MPLHTCDPQPVERPFQAAHWEQGKERSVDCRSGYLERRSSRYCALPSWERYSVRLRAEAQGRHDSDEQSLARNPNDFNRVVVL